MIHPKRVEAAGRVAAFLILVGFAVLASHGALRPFLEAREEVDGFREAVRILSDAEGSVEKLDEEIRLVAAQIAETETLLPKNENMDAFLERLDQVAAETGVRIERFLPRETVSLKLCRALPVELHLAGSFPSIYDFLLRLEEGDRLSRVSYLKISRSEAGGPCQADVSLALYTALPEEV